MSNPLAAAWSRIGATLYDPFLALGERRGMADRRRELLASADGRVLEIGAGTGLNLEHYPDDVEALVLSEPDPAMARRLERRVHRARPEATVIRAGAEALPVPDASFDAVVSTLVLCTVPDPAIAVAELRRVLRPGGRLLFIEHLRAGDPARARMQDRLSAPWRAFAAGCNCNRSTLEFLAGAFDLGTPRRDAWRGMPRIVQPLAFGAAARVP